MSRRPAGDSIDVHVGKRVRERRVQLGMSQKNLAEAVGVSFQQIQKNERGTNRIGASRMFELSKVLDVPVSFFFDDLPPQPPIKSVVTKKALAEKMDRTRTFRQGFAVTELLASALVDMKLHLAGDADIDPAKFEKDTLAELHMPAELPMRHRTPQFGHVFSSDGYSAGYYSYLWSEVLALDAVEAFREAPGGLYDAPTAKRLHDEIMSVGNTVDPAEAYRRFRGRDPDVGAYLRDKGFPAR